MTDTPPSPASRRRLLIGGAAALTLGAAIMVLAVLPAEYGIDPTGFGRMTGLADMAQPATNPYLEKGLKRQGVLTISETPLAPEPGVRDHWTFDIGPYEGIELKYVVAQGKPIRFHWSATGPLDYDMHAHPFDGGTDLTESYSIAKADHLGGRYVAPFTGIHGWYWQNRGLATVRLTLDASGAITGSKIFDTRGEHDRALTPPAR
ncbi:hypothetical protein Q4610_10840 [Sphingobium sp. HBC34]|uniref:Uncharacterized protein n=1 Tax=Sphingobium cyanobacteriorum TaxID=3063954 RepID=A0ABT8ZN40_9SPHN|nr:hypothetical protein [Sphingobium sp. HBC34]MDO7835538.1 hypothetical protein [Sphingobium sp. HBC34]